MNNQERNEFVKIMKITAELYGKPEPAVGVIQMYFSVLANYSLDDVKAGINAHVHDPDQGQFYPKPADIVRNIQGSSETQAQTAWTKVDRAIKSAGSWSSVVFDDALIHAVIADMGGWIELCKISEQDYPFKQNEFVKRYRGYVIHKPINFPKILIGMTNAYNSSKGFECEKPVVIGDREKAVLVYKSGSDKNKTEISTFENLRLPGERLRLVENI